MPDPRWCSFVQVKGIWDEYPRHRRSGPGAAHRAMVPELDELAAEGNGDPVGHLLLRVQAFARSWAATGDRAEYVPSLARWLADKEYLRPDLDWAKPGSKPAPTPDQAAESARRKLAREQAEQAERERWQLRVRSWKRA